MLHRHYPRRPRRRSRSEDERCCWCFSCDCDYIEKPEQKCGFWAVCVFVYSLVDYFIPISLVSVLLWLVLRPSNLRPRVDAAVAVSFSLDNATSSLDYDFAVDLRFRNLHRHLDVRYLDLVAVASYGGERLGPSADVLPVFVQRPMASNAVRASFQGSAAPLAPEAAELFAMEAANGSFGVLVKVASTFMYKFPFQKTVYYLDHDCYIRFPAPNGTVVTPGTLCSATARK